MDSILLNIIACPICNNKLSFENKKLICYFDKIVYPILDSIPIMLIDKAIRLS